MRDSKGRFLKGHSGSIESEIKRMYSLQESWKNRENYIGDIKSEYPKIYNSWRSIMFTDKGKSVGHSEEWNSFRNFYNDVRPTYKQGLVFRRLDITKPYSKDNFIWIDSKDSYLLKSDCISLEYKGERLSLKELADKYEVSLCGIRSRYHKHKDYTVEEIIFGKRKNRNSKGVKDKSETSNIRAKASKMLSSYRFKDRKMGLKECDLSIEEMVSVMNTPCVYCGDTHRVGLDRINNELGHTRDNIVPCCYDCNCARNNNFSFEEMKEIGKVISKIKEKRNTIK